MSLLLCVGLVLRPHAIWGSGVEPPVFLYVISLLLCVWDCCAVPPRRDEGLSSFYSGMSAKMSQTVMNSAFMFLMYEKIFALIVKSYVVSLRLKSKVKVSSS